MKTNMGGLDRAIRAFVVAPSATFAAVVAGLATWASAALLAIALVMLVTAALGFCPNYIPFGINTKPGERRIHSPIG